MLVVIGVRKDTNRKVFLALQKGDKESASSWREVFKDMKARGEEAKTGKSSVMNVNVFPRSMIPFSWSLTSPQDN